MIARTVEVTAEFTKNIIEAQAVTTDRIIDADAEFGTKITHYHSDYEDYEGEYHVTPDWDPQVLETENKVMRANVEVDGIYINSVQNPAGGNTVYIGGELNYG